MFVLNKASGRIYYFLNINIDIDINININNNNNNVFIENTQNK